MAWAVDKLLKEFRLTIPAMSSITDEEVLSDIESYQNTISERVFGKKYPKALAYFIAHMRTMQTKILNADGDAASPTLTAGNLISEKEGDLQRGYAASSSNGADSNADTFLKKSMYGQMLLFLRDTVVVGATIRRGQRRCFL